jgi:hypothetical protein
MILIVLLLLLITVVISVIYNTKEGNENQYGLTPGVIINTDTNTLTVPNNVQGVSGTHLNFGDVSIHKSLSFVQDGKDGKDRKDLGTIAYKDDTLQMTGAGTNQRISLWDKVDVGSLLTVGGDIQMGTGKSMNYENKLNIVGGPSSVVHLGEHVDISGNMTVFGNQDVSKNQSVEGVSTHKGKVNIGPTDATVDLSIGDELTGFKQGKGTQGSHGVSFTSNNTNMGGFDSKGLFVNNDALFELGKGVTGKDAEAGTIQYTKHPEWGDLVNFVGGGDKEKEHKIMLKDDVAVNGRLGVKSHLWVNEDAHVGGIVQIGSWNIFEDKKGRLRFYKHTREPDQPRLTREQLIQGDTKGDDGIMITGDGNIFTTQKNFVPGGPGSINEKIKNTEESMKSSVKTTKIGDWELTQGPTNDLIFTNSTTKSSIVMTADGTVGKKYVAGTFENETRNLNNVPYKEWERWGAWKKHLEGNSIKYVSNPDHYWRVVSNGYEYAGSTK